MQLGRFRLTTISGGRFRLDGGAMFGVIPQPLWSRRLEPDAQNRIPLATNCVLIETGQTRLLIDTGPGDKLTTKEREIFALQGGTVCENLLAAGLAPESIDYVVLSHLHFDHAGGRDTTTRRYDYGQFPFGDLLYPRAGVGGRKWWWARMGGQLPTRELCLPGRQRAITLAAG